MVRKIVFFVVILTFSFQSTSLLSQVPGGWEDQDPAPIPLPGVLYFLIAALGVGAKKIYDARKRF